MSSLRSQRDGTIVHSATSAGRLSFSLNILSKTLKGLTNCLRSVNIKLEKNVGEMEIKTLGVGRKDPRPDHTIVDTHQKNHAKTIVCYSSILILQSVLKEYRSCVHI